MIVTKLVQAPCNWCSGEGWKSIYHNDIEECRECNGSGIGAVQEKVSFSELQDLADAVIGCPEKMLTPSDMLLILRTYDKWKKS